MRIDNLVHGCEMRNGLVCCFRFFVIPAPFCHSRASGNPKG